jgi:hypothetical protein
MRVRDSSRPPAFSALDVLINVAIVAVPGAILTAILLAGFKMIGMFS